MNRSALLDQILEGQPKFRVAQIKDALFNPAFRSWDDLLTLPKELREKLKAQGVPFLTVKTSLLTKNKANDTVKALLKLHDGTEIETVLMKNARDAWTLCVSSQVGCAMACGFCATGSLGLSRNLSADEIVDQYRYFRHYLADQPGEQKRISNIVYMGMGEPLANYTEVRKSLNALLGNTDIGKTRITVSTVGVLPRLEQILTDEQWPHVRLAVSVHSADAKIRASFMPSSGPDFLPKLIDWSRRYLEHFGNRRHHLTFEYVMLANINDSVNDAKLLAKLVKSIGNVRVNLIPYNTTMSIFTRSPEERMSAFQGVLRDSGVLFTTRKSQGQDIAAACGQLAKTNC